MAYTLHNARLWAVRPTAGEPIYAVYQRLYEIPNLTREQQVQRVGLAVFGPAERVWVVVCVADSERTDARCGQVLSVCVGQPEAEEFDNYTLEDTEVRAVRLRDLRPAKDRLFLRTL